jgi:hypothetical protein
VDPLSPRIQAFVTAQRRGELTLQQLWLRYIALTGTCGAFEIDAFLHGLSDLPAAEQDILAHALNERLDEVHQASQVPYRTCQPPSAEDPLAVLNQLLDSPLPPTEPQSPGGWR